MLSNYSATRMTLESLAVGFASGTAIVYLPKVVDPGLCLLMYAIGSVLGLVLYSVYLDKH